MAISSFALRMPAEVKDAAKALTKVSFCEPSDRGGGYVNSICLSSINEALVYLMKTGLRQTLVHVNAKLDQVKSDLEISQEIVGFFLSAPAATEIRPFNLPEGSKARPFLEEREAEFARQIERESTYDVPLASGDESVALTREEAVSDLSLEQHKQFDLTAAKGAIQKALIAEARA